MRWTWRNKSSIPFISLPLIVLFVCEYLIYVIVQFQCDWPRLGKHGDGLHVLFLADTHLLGPFKGHWFDKLRREWQMSTAFATAERLHSPDIVFFLGDVFDEGQWVDQKEYEEYVERFYRLFPTQNPYVLVGNHDVGFHNIMSNYRTLERFYRSFNLSSSDILRIRGTTFVTLNSMAMENDGCSICKDAENRLKSISKSLLPGEKPFLLQHFPLYRVSDSVCQGEDSAPEHEKTIQFRPKLDCLSKSSSNWLLQLLKPRAIFSGHTHHSCVYHHGNITEYSVPSFSWRNRNDPSYFLVTFSNDDYAVRQCFLPRESSVIQIYVGFCIAVIGFGVYHIYQRGRKIVVKKA